MIKRTHPYLALFLALVALPAFVQGQGTAFTYNGRLMDGGNPANAEYDLRFSVFDDPAAGNQVGPTLTRTATAVNGLFTVILDFGEGVFTGPPRWLQLAVASQGNAEFTLMNPRQPMTAVPYAVYAGHAGAVAVGAVTAEQLNTGGLLPAPGQFLSYDGGNLSWADPAVAGGNIWSLLNNNAFYNAGSVGIGTNSPEPGYRLEVHGATRLTTGGSGGVIRFGTPSGETGMTISGNNRADIRFNGSVLSLLAGAGTSVPHPANGLSINTQGDVGVGRNLNFGSQGRQMLNLFGSGFGIGVQTANLYQRSGGGFAWHVGGVHNEATYASGGGTTAATLDLTSGLDFGSRLGQHLSLWGSTGSRRFALGIQAATLYSRAGGNPGDGFAWYKGGVHSGGQRDAGGGETLMTLDGEKGLFVTGEASVCSITVRGGCDLAEPFPMPKELEKGSVVVIDEEHPGRLKLSTQACDPRVAGIISGANGVNTGIALMQEGTFDQGQNVALSGRVYVKADASHGAIKPGDLLTTSDTPGHAMRVTHHASAQGAILGKAMTPLSAGKGMVLVLVTLQ
jgi:hypothetical protein